MAKKLEFKRLVEVQNLDIMFLHESMCDGFIIVVELEKLIKGWKFEFVDAKGKSGGFLLGWKVNCFLFKNVWVVFSDIGISLYSIELEMNLWYINIYGLY